MRRGFRGFQWIRTGRQIGQAVKNVQRLRQIVNVFARHGFADIVHRVGLERFLPQRFGLSRVSGEQSIPERLRSAFEELGPTFVKLGQLLATRPDLIPDNFVEEFKKLQDNVAQVPFAGIKEVLETELGQTVEESFAQFEEKPLASASIAQVHVALLHSGEKVVVKVQRPGIKKAIQTDVALLEFIAKTLERYVEEIRFIRPTLIVEEFFRTLSFELDFHVEANNMIRFGQNMREFPNVVVPRVYKALSSTRVLTQEKLEGISLNDEEGLKQAGVDGAQVVETGARAFFKAMMIDGLFHGDLHGGNLFVLPGNRVGIVDFGIMGRLSQKARDQLINIMLALINEDFENLCYQYVELGPSDPSIDFESYQRESRNTLSPYIGLNLSEIDSGRILMESTRIAAKYNIRISGEWMVVFKGIVTIEGLGKSLDPDFNFLALGKELLPELVRSQYSPKRLATDLFWASKEVSALLRVLPRNLQWMVRKWKQNNFALEVKAPQIDELKEQLSSNSKRTSLGFVTAGLFVASALALQFTAQYEVLGYPLASVVFFGLAVILLIRMWVV